MLVVETDKKGHAGRDPDYEMKRQKDLEYSWLLLYYN